MSSIYCSLTAISLLFVTCFFGATEETTRHDGIRDFVGIVVVPLDGPLGGGK